MTRAGIQYCDTVHAFQTHLGGMSYGPVDVFPSGLPITSGHPASSVFNFESSTRKTV